MWPLGVLCQSELLRTLPLQQALLVGFGILAPHIAHKHTSKRYVDRSTIFWTDPEVSSLKSFVLKGICGNGKCSKDTLARSHVTAKDSSSQLTTRHSHNKWCDERLAWTQCHAGNICFQRAYLHVSALHFYLNSVCMHKSAPNYLF